MILSPFSIYDMVDHATSVCQVPEGTCLLAYRGSIAHGMYVPSTDPTHIDDVDLIGVVLGSPENYLGLREWGSRGTYEYKEGKWDAVYYEIRKLFSLLLQGNPNVLSMLWLQNQPSTVRTVYQFQCHICKIVAEQNWMVVEAAYPHHPGPGWQQIGMEVGPSLWICPAHKVVITVDGVDFNKLNGATQGEVTCHMCAALCRPCSAHSGKGEA